MPPRRPGAHPHRCAARGAAELAVGWSWSFGGTWRAPRPAEDQDRRKRATRYFDAAREVVDRYGGTIEKFIGDAVIAVWGAPMAHEDDAERAVRAALDLVDAVADLGVGRRSGCGPAS